ncbi:MAG TPA: flagellar protein FliT [Burkholderiales bacterium]|jgi:flagellar protein FliT|nr:flagellar protein FliT [Burkholderiales bacterium]
MDIIAHYAAIADASGRMLAAARCGDWDGLVTAEEECAHRVATLEALGDVAPRDAHERHMRIVILKDILAHDAEIRELTAPWLTQLETMLRNMSRGRHVRQAYL